MDGYEKLYDIAADLSPLAVLIVFILWLITERCLPACKKRNMIFFKYLTGQIKREFEKINTEHEVVTRMLMSLHEIAIRHEVSMRDVLKNQEEDASHKQIKSVLSDMLSALEKRKGADND